MRTKIESVKVTPFTVTTEWVRVEAKIPDNWVPRVLESKRFTKLPREEAIRQLGDNIASFVGWVCECRNDIKPPFQYAVANVKAAGDGTGRRLVPFEVEMTARRWKWLNHWAAQTGIEVHRLMRAAIAYHLRR